MSGDQSHEAEEPTSENDVHIRTLDDARIQMGSVAAVTARGATEVGLRKADYERYAYAS